MTFELIEISHHKELPKGVEMVLYAPPYLSTEPIHEAANQFKKKYGNEPKTIYQLNNKLFIVKDKTND